jgi:hypothetical protein
MPTAAEVTNAAVRAAPPTPKVPVTAATNAGAATAPMPKVPLMTFTAMAPRPPYTRASIRL